MDPAIRMAFPRTMAKVRPATAGRCDTRKTGLIIMPTETKNSVAKRSRRGMTSARIWWLWSDSETMMPARKAPRARERPKE
ncbi:hypothetical protein D3C72_1452540 [compost metagenome]